MNAVPTEPVQLTAEWLSEIRHNRDHLPRGAMVSVEQAGVTNSYALHLRRRLPGGTHAGSLVGTGGKIADGL